jgi:hypothetical protein
VLLEPFMNGLGIGFHTASAGLEANSIAAVQFTPQGGYH